MKQYIVDAFTDKIFSGNQAAICVMDSWPSEKLMMNIARENNFSETAFIVKNSMHYKLRWFTPNSEIDLCGHATLASAFVLMNFYDDSNTVVFDTISGPLAVKRDGDFYSMNFPAYKLNPVPVTNEIISALGGVTPEAAFMGRDLLCILKDSESVINCKPDLEKIKSLDGLLVHVTAQGKNNIDCISRSFAPKLAINEDPVCGSGHCHIAPYWINKLNKKQITAYQASQRGGYLHCELEKDRVIISGQAVLFSEGKIFCEI